MSGQRGNKNPVSFPAGEGVSPGSGSHIKPVHLLPLGEEKRQEEIEIRPRPNQTVDLEAVLNSLRLLYE